MNDPIVIDPPNFNLTAAWQGCSQAVEEAGGMTHEDGEPNWRAAFSADPGCCSCPVCREYYWAWGNRQRCVKCGFEYPVDAWPMYSWGVQDAWWMSGIMKSPDPDFAEIHKLGIIGRRKIRMQHEYYRYGFEHPPQGPAINLVKEFERIDWRKVLVPIGGA